MWSERNVLVQKRIPSHIRGENRFSANNFIGVVGIGFSQTMPLQATEDVTKSFVFVRLLRKIGIKIFWR